MNRFLIILFILLNPPNGSALAAEDPFRLDCRVTGALYPLMVPNLDRIGFIEIGIAGKESQLVLRSQKPIPMIAKGKNGRYELRFPRSNKPSILQLDGDPTRLPNKIRFHGTIVAEAKSHGDVVLDCYSFR